jgi:hypothetical protein
VLALLLGAALPTASARAQSDANDWPMYNRDIRGTRHILRAELNETFPLRTIVIDV